MNIWNPGPQCASEIINGGKGGPFKLRRGGGDHVTVLLYLDRMKSLYVLIYSLCLHCSVGLLLCVCEQHFKGQSLWPRASVWDADSLMA